MVAVRLFLAFATLGTAAGCPFVDGQVPGTDAERAKATRPRDAFLAEGAALIRERLNTHLVQGALAYPSSKPCEEFTLAELDAVLDELRCHSSDRLDGHYSTNDGRKRPRDDAAPAHNGEAAVEAALKVGKCHNAAMAWVHHLTEAGRASVAANSSTILPLLPKTGLADHWPVLKAGGHDEVAKWLSSTVTCQIGHETTTEERDTTWTPKDFPKWPSEVTYNASGYGPYPFWAGGGGSGGSLSGKGADITTYYSAVYNAERLDHSSCSLSSLGTTDGPCTHLFLNGSWAFLFKQDESFCCMSSAPVKYTPCHLTRPQRNFMDVMTYNGVIDYTSEDGLYSGKAKKYSMHLTFPSNFWFWYVTDMDDKPLEQGEGPCDMYDDSGSRNCNGPPKMLFHQYHTKTFKQATLDYSVFDLPKVCQKTPYTYCMVQPTNFCG